MKPQDQEFLKTETQAGDCARAVIASLLELPMTEVPHFLAESDGTSFGFYDLIEKFLAKHGYEMHWHSSLMYHLVEGQEVYHYISGPSPRGNALYHAVVGMNGLVAHDPHPSREGLLGTPNDWHYGFLVPIQDP